MAGRGHMGLPNPPYVFRCILILVGSWHIDAIKAVTRTARLADSASGVLGDALPKREPVGRLHRSRCSVLLARPNQHTCDGFGRDQLRLLVRAQRIFSGRADSSRLGVDR